MLQAYYGSGSINSHSTETQLHWKLVLMSVCVHQTVGTCTCLFSTSHGGREEVTFPHCFHRRCPCSPVVIRIWHLSWMAASTMPQPPCQHPLHQKAVVTVLSTGTMPFLSALLTSREDHPHSLFPPSPVS